MNITNQIIEMWKVWTPERFFVAPYRISGYYWDKYLHSNGLQPIFPDDEINDLAAVIANSKPAAIMNIPNGILPSYRTKNCQEIALDMISIAVDNNVFMKRVVTQDCDQNLVCSKNEALANEIIEAFQSTPRCEKLGRLLGYPEQSIQDFRNNFKIKEENPSFAIPSFMFNTHS